MELRSAGGIANPLPLVFRAMVLTDLVAFSEDATATGALAGAVQAVVQKAGLTSLRHCLRAIDAGIGQAVEILIGTPVVSPVERRALEARLRPLRDQLRQLRQSAVPIG